MKKNENLNVLKFGYSPWKYPRNWFSNIANFFRNIKRAYHRVTKGYCSVDLFSMDYWLLTLIPEALKEYNKVNDGFPDSEFNSMEEWQAEVNKIIECFEEAEKHWKFSDAENKYDEEFSKLLVKKFSSAFLSREKGNEVKFQPLTPEEEELEKNYYAEAERLHKYGNEKLKEGFDLLYKNFGDLWW